VLVASQTTGTCDTGDSITHFLFARWAPSHPERFFDHWGKPVFTLLASPFAQFGFVGIKIFNALVAVCTAVLVQRIAARLGTGNSWLAGVFLFLFPLYTITVFSGLTEPLFGLILSAGVLMMMKEKNVFSLVLFSFLPFCRSEGLVVLIVVTLYLFVSRKFKFIPLLAVGHLVFAMAGFPFYHDLLWVFNRIPYDGNALYGHGGWLHFFEQSPYIFGLPLILPLVIGLFLVFKMRRRNLEWMKEVFLIHGIFLAVFFAHVIFWRFGLFNSDGLKRVMVAVLPLGSVIALRGFETLSQWLARKIFIFGRAITALLLTYILIFPFLPNPAAFDLKNDFSLKPEERAMDRAAGLIERDFSDHIVYSSQNYMALALDRDFFDRKVYIPYVGLHDWKNIPSKTIVVLDDWFGMREGRVTEKELLDAGLKREGTFTDDGKTILVFRKGP
jgi:hypothetical protein